MLLLSGMLLLTLAQPADIGSRLELLVDDALIAEMRGGAALLMHSPTPQEIVLVHDAPWEGTGCGYDDIFQDGPLYRLYYKAWDLDVQPDKLITSREPIAAYAESTDGIHWTKPNLGLFEFNGSKDNNIIWTGKGGHDFTPFRDENPACPPGEEYKAISYGNNPKGAYAFVSSDAIHWQMMQDAPIITSGAFDTENIAFWDSTRNEYRAYIRDFRNGVRGIRTCSSKDFRTWTSPEWLVYPGLNEIPLYTNEVKPYFRAPHLFIGFPARYCERGWGPAMEALPELEHRRWRSRATDRYGMAITDSLLMTSRDGVTFKRWDEAFLRPGLRTRDNWKYGDNYIAWHVVQTKSAIADAPDELSLYATEHYWTKPGSALRRYTLRMDGFVSLHAPMSGGEMITKPLLFTGKRLLLNYSTSAAGGIRVEVQQEDGTPLPGFEIDRAPELFGDSLEQAYPFADGKDLAALAGTPVRLRFVLKDADVYAFKVAE